jgi:hypothetical protein
MWIYTTNNEMINISRCDRLELRQETAVPDESGKPASDGVMVGISIVARFDHEEAVLAFIPAAENYDLMVNRYWNAIRTAIKSRAELCDLMDIA